MGKVNTINFQCDKIEMCDGTKILFNENSAWCLHNV